MDEDALQLVQINTNLSTTYGLDEEEGGPHIALCEGRGDSNNLFGRSH